MSAKYVPLGSYCQKTNFTIDRNNRAVNGSACGSPLVCQNEDANCNEPRDMFYTQSKALKLERLGQRNVISLDYGSNGYKTYPDVNANTCPMLPTANASGAFESMAYDYNPNDCSNEVMGEQCNRPATWSQADKSDWSQEGCNEAEVQGKYATLDNLSCLRSAVDSDFKPMADEDGDGAPTYNADGELTNGPGAGN